ncbi:siphovirus Gp157 family protein [Microvirga mediterraneensis]|uniref:Siphovirus Gp157 family protein n=1 Tax=Microvirga mediterraneensis TaxID=2754695 RepID=A0A838BR43_9HYPH|nr:siphovirus Gp157 family protein [Microvirga mediterraneensis]MBA1156896.1 siphovirus Gp157 family protein [Microvirga mediterraneensis]MBA1157801.1 siphovirus Gp157 family protein [Microvirga mediterraneensis]
MNPIQISALERQIEDLIASYPELAEDETLRADMVQGSTDAEEILSKVVDRMMEAESMASAIGKRVDDLKSRQAAYDRRSDAMRKLAFRIMSAAQVRKMPLPEATLSIRAVPQSVVVTDMTKLPREYVKTKTEESADRQKLKEALQEGKEIPGAMLSNGGETLAVKVK